MTTTEAEAKILTVCHHNKKARDWGAATHVRVAVGSVRLDLRVEDLARACYDENPRVASNARSIIAVASADLDAINGPAGHYYAQDERNMEEARFDSSEAMDAWIREPGRVVTTSGYVAANPGRPASVAVYLPDKRMRPAANYLLTASPTEAQARS